ncbi:SpoIIE family protein phosphatase [Streptomyces sp. V3I7]|uniref:SpoIIE family protein phosphatase n=1 Tax=Streptomyces sp. V3I7 TaxID=3042278 RepID=UPI002784F642|nr:SpoIIE family protein phosphatase [Streptomyces sp. V3I7]MDQ0988937.1 serine phosphatase RsbU (regulator of sigma subunit)/PAS domain-containing protein/anti-sigma regulatory factor (Ser/Thr protein kinase) [Streptomyces sp. V3I7]
MERPPTPPGNRPDQPEASPAEPPGTATATISDQGVVTGWSDGAQRLLGYAAPEIVGRPATTLLADGAEDTAAWRASAGQDRRCGTVALRHRDGRRLKLGVLAHRRTRDGAPAEWLLVSPVPGTRRSPVDTALQEWTFSQSPCLQAIFDTGLRLVRANAGMEHALSLAEAAMRGLLLSDIAPGRANEETARQLRRALETGEPQRATARFHPADGGPVQDWPAYLTPLKDTDGQVRAVSLTAHHAPQEPGRLLAETRTRIGTTLDLGRTAQELADHTVPRLADFTAVDLLDSPRPSEETSAPGPVALRRAAVRALPEDVLSSVAGVGEPTSYPAHSPPAECLASGRSILHRASDDAVTRWIAEGPSAGWLRASGTHSVLVVPMRSRGATLGVALFARTGEREPFDARDVAQAEELTAEAAAAIDNARKYTRAHTTTMALQRSLLPQTLPEQEALDIGSRYLAAGSRAGVGGDWFDVIPLSGARVALVVGDVVGHGARASATMGRLRTAVRTLADVDLPADELLAHLDDLVLHLSAEEGGTDPASEAAGGIGSTCLYAVYDPVSRRCTLARAGHPLPVVVTPDGRVRFLEVPAGPPLGLGGFPFECAETELPEGSLLVLYTDGLLEARDHDIDEALDKMFAALAHPAPTPEAVCDRVLTALLSHQPDDDVALLVARTRALHPEHVATWDLDGDPSVVGRARKHADDQLRAWGLEDATFVTELVVSELVTNAIRYGRAPIQLRLIHQNKTLICEVFDSSSTSPHMRRAQTFDEGGRGLLLIAQLARSWGTRHDRIGKTVWAEFPLGED